MPVYYMCSAELSWEAANYRVRADQEDEPACPNGKENVGRTEGETERVKDNRELEGNKEGDCDIEKVASW